MKFSDYAAKTPDINFAVVRQSKNHLGASVVATLNIGVNGFLLKTARPKIDDFYSRFIGLL